MKKNLYLIAFLSIACLFPAAAQNKATGLSEIKLFLDPGHSLKENMGIYNYSEAEKTLRVALAVKEYLLTYTDMKDENILLSRLDDNTQVTLTQRTDMANAWGADFYYSMHSDAGDPSASSTLFLYGGRRLAAGDTPIEKLPEGGKAYGDILNPNLTGVMRTGTRGNINDLVFYNSSSLTPYLHVNRETEMASHLSEAAFHTNPVQNMRNMNAEWKRLQAYAAYQSLVEFLSAKYGAGEVEPVQVGITTGFITDGETDLPINGATITVTEGETVKTYTTDTYESLFYKYSNKPEELRNGFYWIEGWTPGATVDVTVEADGFETQQGQITIPATIGTTTSEGLGIRDFQLLNLLPAIVSSIDVDNLNNVVIRKPITLTFSRKMDRESVEEAISFSPNASVTYNWTNDFTLKIDISQLNYETDYVLTIDGAIAKNSLTNNFLDGDNNGTEGGNYVLNFTTGEQDLIPPVIVSYDPQGIQEESVRPIVRIEFNEPLNESTIAPNQIVVVDKDGETVGGNQYYVMVNEKSVLHYIFTADLNPNETYTVNLASGIEDLNGNQMPEGLQYTFTAHPRETTLTTVLDNFNTMSTAWWQPNGSGSTLGINTDTTRISIDTNILATAQNTGSFRLNYLWSEEDVTRRIRIHNTATTPKFSKDNIVQFYLFGDGSHTKLAIALRNGASGAFWTNVPIEIDWVGWKLVNWDLTADPFDNWAALGTGTSDMPEGNNLNLSAIRVEPAPVEYLVFTPSTLWLSQLQVVKLGDYITGIKQILAKEGINIYTANDYIQITAMDAIKDAKVYAITGALVKSVQPGQASCTIPTNNLAPGVYIVKVSTGTSQANMKVIVK